MKEDFQCRKKKDDDVKNGCKDKEMKTLDKVSSIEAKQKESTLKMEADLQNCAVEIKKRSRQTDPPKRKQSELTLKCMLN